MKKSDWRWRIKLHPHEVKEIKELAQTIELSVAFDIVFEKRQVSLGGGGPMSGRGVNAKT